MIFVYAITILIGLLLFAQGVNADQHGLGALSAVLGAALFVCGIIWTWEELHGRRRGR